MSSMDLEKQLCFYGSYHHNRINVAIHMVCVPIILLSAFILATNSPTFIPLPSWLTVPHLPLNMATIIALGYSIFYVLLEPVAGTALVPLILGVTAYGHHLTNTYPATTNKYMILLHVLSWLAQFVGHGVFEGRAPALLDNLVQAVVLAPFFVWMEFLFAFGYRPELRNRVDKAVAHNLENRNAAKTVKAH